MENKTNSIPPLFYSFRNKNLTELEYLKLSNRIYSNDNGNYYIVGVLFMISVIILLLYVNLYREYCLRDTLIQLLQMKYCCLLRYFFTVTYVQRTNTVDDNFKPENKLKVSSSNKKIQITELQKNDIDKMHL